MIARFYQYFLKPLYEDVRAFILDTLMPITCLACGKEGSFICSTCLKSFKKLDHQICIACKKPAPFGVTHPSCKAPYGADGLISFYDYHDKRVSTAIIKGKYSFIPGVFEIFGQQIAPSLATNYQPLLAHFSLVPIPLYPQRRRWRGFNQAEVICQSLAKSTYLPVVTALVRTKRTKTQKDLKRQQRIENVDGAFSLNPSRPTPNQTNAVYLVKGKNFILVDDVTTTGSTLLEAVKVLKRNGAAQVWCLTIARD